MNSLFVLSFQTEGDRKVQTGYYFPKKEIKDYNVVIDGKTFSISLLKTILEHMIIFEKFQQDKEMTIQLVV